MQAEEETMTPVAAGSALLEGAVAVRRELFGREYLRRDLQRMEASLLQELVQGHAFSAWRSLDVRWGFTDGALQELSTGLLKASPALFASEVTKMDPLMAYSVVPVPISEDDYGALASAWASVRCGWVSGLLLFRFVKALRDSQRPIANFGETAVPVDVHSTARIFGLAVCRTSHSVMPAISADIVEHAASLVGEAFQEHGSQIFRLLSSKIGKSGLVVNRHRGNVLSSRELCPSLLFLYRDGDRPDLVADFLSHWRDVLRSGDADPRYPTGGTFGPPLTTCFEAIRLAIAADLKSGGTWWSEEWRYQSELLGPWSKGATALTVRRLFVLASMYAGSCQYLSEAKSPLDTSNLMQSWTRRVLHLLPEILLAHLPVGPFADARAAAEMIVCMRLLVAGATCLPDLAPFLGQFTPYIRNVAALDAARSTALDLNCPEIAEAIDVVRPQVEEFSSVVRSFRGDATQGP